MSAPSALLANPLPNEGKEPVVKRHKVSLCTYERAAIHARLGKVLKRGNPAEILLIVYLLLALCPVPHRKAAKRKGSRNGCP